MSPHQRTYFPDPTVVVHLTTSLSRYIVGVNGMKAVPVTLSLFLPDLILSCGLVQCGGFGWWLLWSPVQLLAGPEWVSFSNPAWRRQCLVDDFFCFFLFVPFLKWPFRRHWLLGLINNQSWIALQRCQVKPFTLSTMRLRPRLGKHLG